MRVFLYAKHENFGQNYSKNPLVNSAQMYYFILTTMKNKRPLITANKFLRNSQIREELILRHAAASAKIEGVKDAKRRASQIAKRSFVLRSA
jgi:hypothetical protein